MDWRNRDSFVITDNLSYLHQEVRYFPSIGPRLLVILVSVIRFGRYIYRNRFHTAFSDGFYDRPGNGFNLDIRPRDVGLCQYDSGILFAGEPLVGSVCEPQTSKMGLEAESGFVAGNGVSGRWIVFLRQRVFFRRGWF